MGRKKVIEDKDLLNLIHDFYVNDCHGNPNKLKLPDITTYIQQHGYPTFRVEVLRRNEDARKYIDELKDTTKESILAKLASYKTLDVDAFLIANPTLAAIRRALSDLDSYYKSIAEHATDVLKSHREREEKLAETTAALDQANETVRALEEENGNLKKQFRATKTENAALRKIVDTYIYPDIANKLLEADAALFNVPTTIKSDILDDKIIDAGTDIAIINNQEPKKPSKKSSVHSGNTKLISIFEQFKE